MAVEYLPAGDTALVVQFGTGIDRALNTQIMKMRELVEAATLPGVIETVPSYRSLMVHYDPLAISHNDLVDALKPFTHMHGDVTAQGGNLWKIPVCFDEEFCPDMGHVTDSTGLSQTEVQAALCETLHHVYMIGFAPGQPYMGDLPGAMNIPRREKPVARIDGGSVVTATGLTIIYPVANPTGWHVVGRTAVKLFDLGRADPVMLTPGDKVRLYAVERGRFDDLAARIAGGDFDVAELEEA